jgi:hypothetical protein
LHTVGVYAWVTDLLAAWRGEPLVLSSTMPVDVARRWLGVGSSDEIRRTAAQLNTRASWRPVLRGRLLPADSGSQFVGILGWDPMLKMLTCCLTSVFAAVFLAGVTVVFFSALTPVSRLTPGLAMAASGLFGVITLVASTVVGYRETRGQTAYLRSWITGQMAMQWFGGRQASDH